MNRSELKQIEGRLRASALALARRNIPDITTIEVIDEAGVWSQNFDGIDLKDGKLDLDYLIEHTPLLICAIATEIGFRFEGVGTVFWAHFDEVFGHSATMAQRQRIADIFRAQADRYSLSRPAQTAFSEHFSNISWPIANALLPSDLIGAVTRLLARAPVGALPGPGRSPSFPSLRAWASAAEGARLADWLRLEAPTARVLTALLTENHGNSLSPASYQRLRDAIAKRPDAFFTARAARLRARTAKLPTPTGSTLGQLALAHEASGLRMFVSWPTLPVVLFEEARTVARSAAWRPRLWNAGGYLHPDMALGPGPFALAFDTVQGDDEPAYPGAAAIFGEGSEAAAALAARIIAWKEVLLFDPSEDRTRAEQRFDALTETSGHVWVASRSGNASLEGLRRLGHACGYTVFEADLAAASDRAILGRVGLTSADKRSLIARHPTDALTAPHGIVRPDRPFLVYTEDLNEHERMPQQLSAGGRLAPITGASGRPGLRVEPAAPGLASVVDLVLFERENLFDALVERRLQLRLESLLPLIDVPMVAELEVGGRLIARGRATFASVPITVPRDSSLFAPLYDDYARGKLLEFGNASLHLAVNHSAILRVELQRPAASVEWADGTPRSVGSSLDTKLVAAKGRRPHRFAPTAIIEAPARGATAYGLQFSDGRIADPVQILTSGKFDLGDLAVQFGEDMGSRRMFDDGGGVGDIARALVVWSRGVCSSLPAVAAKTRIVRQFEEPLVISLCGRSWWRAEEASLSEATDAHIALWHVALERGLVHVPEGFTPDNVQAFALAFRRHARALAPDWPAGDQPPLDGIMDDALNQAFAQVVHEGQTKGALLDIDADDVDFGSPAEDWERSAGDALNIIRRPRLYELMVPSGGARELMQRSYANLSLPELAEDLSAWTRRWALARGRMSPDVAASALHLWLTPAACDDVDGATHALVVDPFVARAVRYAALRFSSTIEGHM
ncbi:MAG: hypothetical protein AB7O40_11850 [Pseudolabrys sp.]